MVTEPRFRDVAGTEFLALGMLVARNLNELLKHAPRTRLGFDR
jgi:hypothetical protein